MDLETLEQVRSGLSIEVMQELTAIVKDKKADVEVRLKAAKVFDGMSDSIIKTHVVTQQMSTADRTNNKLVRQIERLGDNKSEI